MNLIRKSADHCAIWPEPGWPMCAHVHGSGWPMCVGVGVTWPKLGPGWGWVVSEHPVSYHSYVIITQRSRIESMLDTLPHDPILVNWCRSYNVGQSNGDPPRIICLGHCETISCGPHLPKGCYVLFCVQRFDGWRLLVCNSLSLSLMGGFGSQSDTRVAVCQNSCAVQKTKMVVPHIQSYVT